ncbi:TolC family protein [Geobacter sp. SVR]|uniref:TolC family protein n=1 Tax=Geobacter sp. SVR TaxID=2495594 RepID=UPI001EF2152D|nr:TolC family protein [Geobacter sp. SVR]
MPGIICIVSPPVRAEAPHLGLPQAVEYSLRNNGELKAFREEKGIHDAAVIRAGLLPNPTLELEGGTGALTGSSAENSVSLWVLQEFPLAGKREKRRSVADREVEMYRWQLSDRERLLRAEVKTGYYDVLLAAKRADLAERAIELERQLLEIAGERLAAGDIPELEMNLVKVELARSEGVRIECARVLSQARAKLWTLMGLPRGDAPAMAGTIDSGTGTAMTKTAADLKRLATGNRPDLKALEAEKGRGDADIILAQAERVPNLTAGLALKRDTTSMEIGGIEGKETAVTIGMRLSMPIPLFDRNQAAVQEARARRNSTDSRRVAAVEAAEREVETAYAGYLDSEKLLSLYKNAIIPQFEENLKLSREAYRLGEIGIQSVIQEHKKFFEVNDGYLTALHGRQAALVNLESATATELTGGIQ